MTQGWLTFCKSAAPKYFFLFGTAGFGGSDAYYGQILGNVRKNLSGAARLLGSFVCQGQMPDAVRQRYQAMEPSENRDRMLDNFDRAVGHPDAVGYCKTERSGTWAELDRIIKDGEMGMFGNFETRTGTAERADLRD